MADVVLIISQKDFNEKELMETKESLQSQGFRCAIASKTHSLARGKSGIEIHPDLIIQDVILGLDMYKAIAFIGGPGAVSYFDDKEALGLAKKAYEKNKIVAAICIAPMILAKSGILKGVKATVWDGDLQQSTFFKQNNITYTGQNVTVDGNIITANGPLASKQFGEAISVLLKILEENQR